MKTLFWQDARIWVRGRALGVDFGRRPKWWFFAGTELGGDPTNWWAPNQAAVEALLQATGWGNAEHLATVGDRLYYRAAAG